MGTFDQFMSDEITIHRQDGSTEEANCNIQSDGITIQNVKVRVEEGDEIHRVNPAGVNEVYRVDEVLYRTPKAFPEDMHHISIKYTKIGSRKDKDSKVPTYHLVNSNLSINSPNSSQGNTVDINLENITINDPEIIEKLNELQIELAKPDKDKNKINAIIKLVLDKAPDVIIGILTGILIK